jgi:hypothetical protein
MSSLQKFHRRTNGAAPPLVSNGGDPLFDKVVMLYVPTIENNGYAALSPDYGNAGFSINRGTNSNNITTTYPSPVNGGSLRFIGSSTNTNMYTTGTVLSGVYSNDFTVEGWFLFSTAAGPNGETLFSITDSASNPLLIVGRSPNILNTLSVSVEGNGGTINVASITSGVFFHLAVVRSGNNVKLFIDGVSVLSFNITTRITNSATPNLIFGGSQTYASSGTFIGYMSEFRITTAARYTSNFTRPSAAFPTWKDNYAKPLTRPIYTPTYLNSASATMTATPGTWDVTPALTYQWQVSSGSVPWSNITGATTTVSPTNPAPINTYRYRLVETATYNGVVTTNYGPTTYVAMSGGR